MRGRERQPFSPSRRTSQPPRRPRSAVRPARQEEDHVAVRCWRGGERTLRAWRGRGACATGSARRCRAPQPVRPGRHPTHAVPPVARRRCGRRLHVPDPTRRGRDLAGGGGATGVTPTAAAVATPCALPPDCSRGCDARRFSWDGTCWMVPQYRHRQTPPAKASVHLEVRLALVAGERDHGSPGSAAVTEQAVASAEPLHSDPDRYSRFPRDNKTRSAEGPRLGQFQLQYVRPRPRGLRFRVDRPGVAVRPAVEDGLGVEPFPSAWRA